ncbi:MAG: hypothetical protein V9G98_10100 [Candidatus Competibacter sp.]
MWDGDLRVSAGLDGLRDVGRWPKKRRDAAWTLWAVEAKGDPDKIRKLFRVRRQLPAPDRRLEAEARLQRAVAHEISIGCWARTRSRGCWKAEFAPSGGRPCLSRAACIPSRLSSP